ncbi:MAG TPA: peptide-methionine (S)-S-oxide reductase MsrA [Gemmatimonadaceae bacterium]|nr:peptide-methionine (S)-S-oxide reductase MsrA [Gemmatimonadaceae bacterium]
MFRSFVRAAMVLMTALPLAAQSKREVAVLAGGCFWGVDAVFKHVKGVVSVVSGYSGGAATTADYETVSEGRSGHAESVKVTYDPSVVSYETLLKIFFTVAHDPTQLNRQGPDTGTQYRSVIFYGTDDQRHAAQAYIAQLTASKVYPRPIVTQVVPLQAFFVAEAYHQDYLAQHPTQPYIVYNDLPKVEHLKVKFPELYR